MGNKSGDADATADAGGGRELDPHSFRLETLRRHFADCVEADGGGLRLDKYALGYDEIYKFLCLLGTVYGWVASDVLQKNRLLKELGAGPGAQHYRTVQSMIQHELEQKLVQPGGKKKELGSGARALLRLHRALAYINAFLERLPAMDKDEKCCPHSQAAYKRTLAQHHSWMVQKAADLGMNMLPTKEGLIHKICGDSPEAYEDAAKTLPEAIKAMQAVYDKTQQIYEKHGLLDIP